MKAKINVNLRAGVNFSELARNSSRYVQRQARDNGSQKSSISPQKSRDRKSSSKRASKSPNWMKPSPVEDTSISDIGAKKSFSDFSANGDKDFHEKGTKNVISETKTEDTNISASKVDAQIERALRLHNQRIKDQKDQLKVDSISLFSKEKSQHAAPSRLSNFVPSEISKINLRKEESEYAISEEGLSQFGHKSEYHNHQELSFKDENFESKKEDLNMSSPLKTPKKVSQNPYSGGQILQNDFIPPGDDSEDLKCLPYDLDLTKSKEKYEKLTDHSKTGQSPNIQFSTHTPLKSSLQHQIEAISPLNTKDGEKSPCGENITNPENCEKLESISKFQSCQGPEPRAQLSTKISKFYYQQQLDFSSNTEAYNLGKLTKNFLIGWPNILKYMFMFICFAFVNLDCKFIII